LNSEQEFTTEEQQLRIADGELRIEFEEGALRRANEAQIRYSKFAIRNSLAG
jgi:hypothetical protein